MIIESIAVEGVRHFRNRVVLGGFKPGLNILVAPNGTGKSTLVDALVTALVQNHRTTGEKLGSFLRHVNYDLTPSVEVVFQARDGKYRLKKSFLKTQSAKLERFEGGQFAAIADGDEAEAWLEQVLSLDRPGAGISKSEHYGIGAILWSRQSEPILERLPGTTDQQLRATVSPTLTTSSAAELAVRDAISREFQYYWAPTGRRYATSRESANVPSLLSEVEAARQRTESAAALVRDLDGIRQQFDDTNTRHSIRLKRRSDQYERLEEVKKQADSVRVLDNEIALAEQTASTVAAHLARISGERDALMEAERQIDLLRPQFLTAENELASLGRRLAEADAAEQSAFEEYSRANAELSSIGIEEGQISDARAFLLTSKSCNEIGSRLAKIVSSRSDREIKTSEAASILAPDDASWKSIIAAQKALKEAEQRVESESLTLRFTPERDMGFTVLLASNEGDYEAKAGIESVVTGLGALDVNLPGVGKFRFSSQVASAAKLQSALDVARKSMASLLAPYGEATVESLENRRAKRARIFAELADLDSRLSALLGDQSVEEVSQQVDELRAKCTDLLSRYPSWTDAPPEPGALDRDLQPRRESTRSAATEATLRFESKVEQRKALASQREAVITQRDKLGSDLARYQETVRRAEANDLSGQINQIGQQDVMAKTVLKKLHSDRAAIPGDPVGEYDSVQKSIERLNSDISADSVTAAELRVQLESHSGAYELLSREEAQFETALRQHRAAETRARQLKILHDEIEVATRAIADSVNAPLAARASIYARRIMSREDVKVGLAIEDRGIVRLSFGLATWNGKMVQDTMSGGEREQIEVSMRLAMASLLAEDEPQVVILDDALTYCDPVRLYRILEVLAEAENANLQVILTGCDADRYASMPSNANLIDLESLLRRSAAA